MGRIKDLVIDLQNEYGYNMEFLPENFDMDSYLKEKANEISSFEEKELFCEKVKRGNI
jgi:hypothetical protein